MLDRPLEPVIRPAKGRTGWPTITAGGYWRDRAPAARHARVVHERFAARGKSEGAGNAGCPLHP